jgi:site-specific DNA-methyltransferase (adenine-specific)
MEITDKITITNEDNMLLMARYPDNYFDLAIVDPPYGINATKMQMGSNPNRKEDGQYPGESTASKLRKGRLNSGGGKLKNRLLNTSNFDWDNEKPSKEYFDELFRVSKNQIIWGGNYFDLPPTRCFIVWNKNQPWDNFSQAELAWTSFDKPAKLFTHSNRGGSNEETKIHPTQKPIYLYNYCLKHFTEQGNKILDTHLGSGSIGIAIHDYGFELTACELDVEYYNKAIERIKNHTSQQTLF